MDVRDGPVFDGVQNPSISLAVMHGRHPPKNPVY
jgi:hypothetical protein